MSQIYRGYPRKELVLSGGFIETIKVLSSTNRHLAGLASDHGVVDTRILRCYHQQINVICRDTVVLLLVLLVMHLPGQQNGRAVYVTEYRICLSEEKRSSLLAFHASTGCDTSSKFSGIAVSSQLRMHAFVTCPGLLQNLGRDECPHGRVLSDAEACIC